MFIKSIYKTLSAGSNTLLYKVGAGHDYLLGANLEETDDTGLIPQPDSGSIWVQDQSTSNSISLCHGPLANGQLSGFGCIPLSPGDEIHGVLWHARANYIGKLNLYIASKAELGPAPNINWNVKPPGEAPIGKLRVIEVAGAADDITIELQPDDGYIWHVFDAVAYHDDTTDRSITWWYKDDLTSTKLSKHTPTAFAVGVKWPLSACEDDRQGNQGLPTMLSHTVYAGIDVSALTAGKKAWIKALVMEYAE